MGYFYSMKYQVGDHHEIPMGDVKVDLDARNPRMELPSKEKEFLVDISKITAMEVLPVFDWEDFRTCKKRVLKDTEYYISVPRALARGSSASRINKVDYYAIRKLLVSKG